MDTSIPSGAGPATTGAEPGPQATGAPEPAAAHPQAAAPGPPGASRPGMMRGLLPHLVWEGVLLLVTIVVVVVFAVAKPQQFSHPANIWANVAIIGLYATALALSFRTGTPNLAIVTIGTATAWWYTGLVNDGTSAAVAWLLMLGAALLVGVLLAVLVGLTPLSGWSLCLVVLFILIGIVRSAHDAGAGGTRTLHDSSSSSDLNTVFIIFT